MEIRFWLKLLNISLSGIRDSSNQSYVVSDGSSKMRRLLPTPSFGPKNKASVIHRAAFGAIVGRCVGRFWNNSWRVFYCFSCSVFVSCPWLVALFVVARSPVRRSMGLPVHTPGPGEGRLKAIGSLSPSLSLSLVHFLSATCGSFSLLWSTRDRPSIRSRSVL